MKNIHLTAVAFIVLCSLSCVKQEVSPASSSTSSSNQSLSDHSPDSTHYVGEHFGGGIVFYTRAHGRHGLIADTADLPGLTLWWNGSYTITGASATAIGSGPDNTKKIILSEGRPGHYAALMCAKYEGGGYRDWFLPSIDELTQLYLQRNVVGGFIFNGVYSSSTEVSDVFAYMIAFYDGTIGYWYKSNPVYVRPVRAF